MNYFLSLLGAILLCLTAKAQVPVTLTIPPDARSSGMGDVGLATSPDAAAQHFNVAKYAFVKNANGGAEVSYTPWLKSVTNGMHLLYLSGYGVLGQQALSASLRYFSMGELAVTNSDGTPINSSANDLAFDLGYSRRFGELFSLGLAFRYVSTNYQDHAENFAINTTGAFGADLGAYFRLPVSKNEWTAGVAFTNIGTKLDMGNGQKAFLPMNLGIGTQYAWQIQPVHLLRFALDINKPLVPQDDVDAGVISGLFSSFGEAYNQVTLSVGAEYSFEEKFFVRGGYYYNSPSGGDRSHASLGLGLCFYDINFDCSYLIATGNNNNALKNTLRFTLGYTFGKTTTTAK